MPLFYESMQLAILWITFYEMSTMYESEKSVNRFYKCKIY